MSSTGSFFLAIFCPLSPKELMPLPNCPVCWWHHLGYAS
jgi:hypothetical protein